MSGGIEKNRGVMCHKGWRIPLKCGGGERYETRVFPFKGGGLRAPELGESLKGGTISSDEGSLDTIEKGGQIETEDEEREIVGVKKK